MFRGRYEHAIDGKGRTSLPSRFREVLSGLGETHVVIAGWLDPCLVAYAPRDWAAFEEKLSAAPQMDPAVVAMQRICASSAQECEVDKLGRLLIPPTLRKHAGLSRDLLWAGMGKRIELWDRERFEERCNEVLLDSEKRTAVATRLAELGL